MSDRTQPPTNSGETPESQPSQEGDSFPRRIGPYRILSILGSGGMGDVYLAQQSQPLNRRVAVKVIRQGRESKQVMARFDTERRALAMMNHPYIAQVHDGGTTQDGRPYFAMEYVQGEPITDYCDAQKLDLTDRLWLFRRVCDAVHHAHQKGIIHRDLKPSNILVAAGKDGYAIPKIIDFGVAKAIAPLGADLDMSIVPQRVVGTIYYMSPEQMEGVDDIDIRTDVYALGVLLYELLVGQSPYHASNGSSILAAQRVLDSEPLRPSRRISDFSAGGTELLARRTDPRTLVRALTGDLDWITMKAIERDRTQRYASVSELETDVRDAMNNHPVQARPPSARYRAAKFVRRHKVMVIAWTIATLSLIAGTIASSVGYANANRARIAARASAERALQAQQRAEQLEARARTANQFLIDMLGAPDPGEDGRDVRVVDLLERASTDLAASNDWSPLDKGALHHALGETYLGLGLLGEASTEFERAVAVLGEVGDGPTGILDAKAMLGRTYLEQGRFEEGETVLTEILARADAIGAPKGRAALKAHNALAFLYMAQGKMDRAATALRFAHSSNLELYGPNDTKTIGTLNNLGVLLLRMGQFDEAEPMMRRVLEYYETESGEEDPLTLTAMNNLGSVLGELGRFEESIPLTRRALTLQRKVLGDNHPNTLGTMNNLTTQLVGTGEYLEARPIQESLVGTAESLFGADHPNTMTAKVNLVRVYLAVGELDLCGNLIDGLIASAKRTFPPQHPQHAQLLVLRGEMEAKSGRLSDAAASLEQGRSMLLASTPVDSDRVKQVTDSLVEVLRDLGENQRAEDLLRQESDP